MSTVLNQELVHLSALFNKDVKSSILPLMVDFPWETEIASKLFEDDNDILEFTPETIKSRLTNFLVPEEIDSFLDSVNIVRSIENKKEIDSIVRSVFEYYKSRKVHQIITNHSDNVSLMVSKIKDIPNTIQPAVKIHKLADLVPSKVIQEDIGGFDKILPTNFQLVKDASPFKGYLPGTVTQFCLTGETRVMMLDGTTSTMESLYNENQTNIGVYSSDLEGNIKISVAKSCQLIRYVTDLIEIHIGDTTLRCTPEHRFLLSSGVYKEAKDLSESDDLVSFDRYYDSSDSTMKGYEKVRSHSKVKTYYTHRLSRDYMVTYGEYLNHTTNDVVVHHKVKLALGGWSKIHNHPNDLELLTKHQHTVLHNSSLDLLGNNRMGQYIRRYKLEHGENPKHMISKGERLSIETELTSSAVSDMNNRNWSNQEYRNRMSKILVGAYSSSFLAETMNTEVRRGVQGTKLRGVFKYIKALLDLKIITKNTILTKELYDINRYTYDSQGEVSGYTCSPRTPKFESVRKYCNNETSEIIQLALNYYETGEVTL